MANNQSGDCFTNYFNPEYLFFFQIILSECDNGRNYQGNGSNTDIVGAEFSTV